MTRKTSLSPWQASRLWMQQHYITMLPQFLGPEYRGFILRKIRDRLTHRMAAVSGSVALPALPEKNGKRIIVAVPHLIIAGAERFLQAALKGLHEDGWDIVIVKTEWHKSYLQTSDHWFTPYARLVPAGHLTANELAIYLTGLQPDALWMVNSKKAYAALPALKRQSPRTRIVDTLFNAHDFHYTNYRLLDLIDATTCENKLIESQLRERYGDAHPVHCIANGIDLEVFHPAARPANSSFTVGFCGRLSPIKNARLMLNLARQLPEMSFLIAGEGPLRQEMENDKPANCQLVGSVADVAAFVGQCDAVIVPSLMDGRPNIVMEAIACGTPVLASRVGAIPEMMAEGRTGFLFDVNDVGAMAQRLRELAAQPDKTEQLRRDCAAFARQYFDVRHFQRAYVELFNTLIVS